MRALILSDIHGNLEALNAVMDAAGPHDTLWNLGDLVGYGASPNQVLERIRPLASVNVRGNHDRVCAGTGSALAFNPVARAAALWTRTELTPGNLAWLRAVEQGPILPEHQPEVTCVHGSPLNEDHYILNMRDAWAPLQQMPTGLAFFGHTHIQGGFAQQEHHWHELRHRAAAPNRYESWTIRLTAGMRHLINPGSVGQPRDGDWRAAFAIYEIADPVAEPSELIEAEPVAEPTVTFYRVPYDLTAAQGRILLAGLPERLASRLREGR